MRRSTGTDGDVPKEGQRHRRGSGKQGGASPGEGFTSAGMRLGVKGQLTWICRCDNGVTFKHVEENGKIHSGATSRLVGLWGRPVTKNQTT